MGLLGQCGPVSILRLVDKSFLVAAEGPSLIFSHPSKNILKRCQLFPNQLTITGLSFVENDGLERSDNSTAFVWAGNAALFVTVHKPSCSVVEKSNRIELPFIPIAATWFENGATLVILSLFNFVVTYDRVNWDLKETGKWECERENLYSGALEGKNAEELVVFSGTTFKGILVWKLGLNGKGLIIHKLAGHQGIPFSISYISQPSKMLLTASDDRSVILWKFTDDPTEEESDKIVSQASADGLSKFAIKDKVFRGHESRVWGALWVKVQDFLFILSVGEDSFIEMTSYDGSAHKRWKAHDNSPIYSLAFDPIHDILYSGARDGSIHKFREFYIQTDPTHFLYDKLENLDGPWTQDLVSLNTFNGRSDANRDYPRNVCLWGIEYLIASMDSGRLISIHLPSQKQEELFYHKSFSRYTILSVSRQNSLMGVGCLEGELFLFKMLLEDNKLTSEKVWGRKFVSKMKNIHWLTDLTAEDKCNLALVVCLGTAYLYRFFYSLENNEKKMIGQCLEAYQLDLPRPGLPSAILTETNNKKRWLLVGDDVGGIYSFPVTADMGPINKNEEEGETKMKRTVASSYLPNVAKESVNAIVEYEGRILSGGRTGGVKTFQLDPNCGELVELEEFCPPFEWIATILRIESELLVCGFIRGCFILYSWGQKRVIGEIPKIGGGHRKWDFRYGDDRGVLTFLRDKEIYASTLNLNHALNIQLKPGLHSRTINCGIILQNNSSSELLLATGSEDGSIRISNYNQRTHTFTPLHPINSHASSVRALASWKNVDGDDITLLLFSGGGKSEVFVTLYSPQTLTTQAKLVLTKGESNDTRVMGLALAEKEDDNSRKLICVCACSDGFVRVTEFFRKRLRVVAVLEGNGHALMKISVIRKQNNNKELVIVAGSSNGFILMWELSLKLLENEDLIPILPSYSTQLLKAAVMSLKTWTKDGQLYLAVGGDDCAVGVWKVGLDSKMERIWTCAGGGIQCGAVTELIVLVDEEMLLSCSNDQVVAKWNLYQGNLIGSEFGGVTDCQGMIFQDGIVICFGNGLASISVPNFS